MYRRLLLACPWLMAGLFATLPSIAQTASSSSGGTTTTGGPNISVSLPNPERYEQLNGPSGSYTDVTSNPRPQNLNPVGVNFLDCEEDLRLDFTLIVSGFTPAVDAHIEVWAGTVDCTQDANRTQTNTGVAQPCWQVANPTGTLNATTTYTLPAIQVYARDVLRYEVPSFSTAGTTSNYYKYNAAFHNSSTGETACHVQPSDAPVPLEIFFIPVGANFQATGTSYEWPSAAPAGGAPSATWDLVAPPPPTITTPLNVGDTLIQIQWTSPGNDPDIAGYAVYSDPPASGTTTGGCSCGSAAGGGANSYIATDAATATTLADAEIFQCAEAAADGAGDDGPLESSVTDAVDESAILDAELEAAMLPEADIEASTEAGVVADGGAPEAAAGDAGAVAGDAGTVDAGHMNCGGINTGGGSGVCQSFNITGHVYGAGGGTTTTTTVDGSVVTVDASTTPVVTTDDSGVSTGSDGGVTLGGGGISVINPVYKAGEIDDITATQLTLTGLQNFKQVVVGVATIDNSGNVGPIYQTYCGTPVPVNDFWKTYKADGGKAGGCALGGGAEAPMFGLGMIAAAGALARRRRR